MDGILLPVKGQTAKNLARTLELPSFPKLMSQEDEKKLFEIWEKKRKSGERG